MSSNLDFRIGIVHGLLLGWERNATHNLRWYTAIELTGQKHYPGQKPNGKKRDCIVCSNRQLGMRKQTKMICKQCTKTYVCNSLFWEIPHHLIVNVYYMPPPARFNVGKDPLPPPPIQCLERSDAQTRVQTNIEWGRGVGGKLAQIVMYVHWIQVNGSFPIRKTIIRYTLFAGNISILQISPSSKLMVFACPKNTIIYLHLVYKFSETN